MRCEDKTIFTVELKTQLVLIESFFAQQQFPSAIGERGLTSSVGCCVVAVTERV